MPPLGPDHAFIFRITHIRNIPWILAHGLRCQSSGHSNPRFLPIGMQELIDKRAAHPVPIPPGGALADYIPFYFTPHSMMLFNIRTGFGGVTQRANHEIAILVSSLPAAIRARSTCVFTDGHAYMAGTHYHSDLRDLDQVDWDILRRRDFKRDPEDLDKTRRYQAEALVHKRLPVRALLGIACYDEAAANAIRPDISRQGLVLPVKVLPAWYF